MMAVISAANNRTVYKSNTSGVTADFTNFSPRITLDMSGHTHLDDYKYDDSAKILHINVAHGKDIPKYDLDLSTYTSDFVANPERVRGTVSEALFDVVCCNKGTITKIRFGLG